jgi:hypothetical protein
MRWGMPPPPRTGGPPVTNIRKPSSPRCRGWLKPDNRCLALQQLRRICAGAEPGIKKKDVVWFALNDDRPLCAFAGIWTEFKGDLDIKSKPVPALTSSMASSRRRRTPSLNLSTPKRGWWVPRNECGSPLIGSAEAKMSDRSRDLSQ